MTSVRNQNFITKSLSESPLQNFENDIRVNDDLESAAWVIPHQEKSNTGGEDTYFISQSGNSVGVFDGVGGWIESGVNPRLYSYKLMQGCLKAVNEKKEINPLKILEFGYNFVKEFGTVGSCTATVASFMKKDSSLNMEIINVGDSGVLVYRKAKEQDEVIFRTKEQQHRFNMPYQLGTQSRDKPQHGNQYNIKLELDDVVVLGTDGLWDNLYNKEIATILSNSKNNTSQQIAKTLANAALKCSLDTNRVSPFAAQLQIIEKNPGIVGGKEDDITVLVVKVQRQSKL